jgi:2-methylcitrate dehydratase PrpD
MPLAMSHWFGWHPTPVFGVFSAAAAAGKLLGLDQEQIVNAFGIAYSQAAGTLQVIVDGALTKRVHAGLAAKAGILSALLAQKGLKGIRNSLEGEYGLYNVYYSGEYDIAPVIKQLGKTFEATNISFKPYPCCRDLHTSIDAILALACEYDITAEEVENIIVGLASWNYHLLCEPAEVKSNPRNIVDAQFSIPYVVATAIVDRKVVIDNFTDAAIKRPDVLELTKKITCRIDPEIDQTTVGSPITTGAKVEIEMKDGNMYSKQVDVPKGNPKNPMAPHEFQAKFQDCARHAVRILPKQNIESAIEMLTNLEEVDDVSRIAQLLT